jgi:electron transfer flavoprotein alpha subunit
MNDHGTVLIFCQMDKGREILPISLECLTAGKRLAVAWEARLSALVMGADISEAVQEMACYGVDEVISVDHPGLENYQPELYTSAFLQVCERVKPKAILMGDTLTSLDLAPRVAFALDTGLITDCVSIEIAGSQVEFLKPVYSSNVTAAYAFASEPCMITLRSRVEEAAIKQDKPKAGVMTVEVELDASAAATEVMERVVEEGGGIKITNADIIVSGGRGIGGAEGFKQLAQLAEVLNAAVGASRPPCDLGWVSSRAQVGQTGEKVAPSLYIAVGISGATQHLAGMQDSKKIVAVNKDPRANIFRIADYGVVGSYEEVVPAFREAIKEMRKQGGR